MTTIGIDPGTKTGIAIYRDGKLAELRTIAPSEFEALLVEVRPLLVIFEDSRLQSNVFPRPGTKPAAMRKIARNVGEIDGLCRDIERLCEMYDVECIGVSPQRKGCKLGAEPFGAITGWTGRSNPHTRDAAMVAHPYRRVAHDGFRPHATRRRGAAR